MKNIFSKFKKSKEKENPVDEQKEEESSEEDLPDIEYLQELDRYDEKNYEILFEKNEQDSKIDALIATKEEVRNQIEILIGDSFYWSTESEEVKAFRRKLEGISKENYERLRLGEYDYSTDNVVLPRDISQETFVKNDKKTFLCGIHIDKGKQFSAPIFQAIECDINKTAEAFLIEMLSRANRMKNKESPELKANECVLKVTGSLEYIYGSIELFNFVPIQRALKYGKPYIELNLCSLKMEKKNFNTYWLKLGRIDYKINDEFNKLDESISIELKENQIKNNDMFDSDSEDEENLSHKSIRKVKSPFSIIINNLTFFTSCAEIFDMKPQDLENLVFFVHCELVYGGTTLGTSFSQAKHYTSSIKWEQELQFFINMEKGNEKLKLNCFPRETVLLMTIYGRKKEKNDNMLTSLSGKGKLKEKDFVVGSISSCIINFKGLLNSGKKSVKLNLKQKANLWNLGEGNDDTIFNFSFKEYEKPIVFPTDSVVSESEEKDLQAFENKMLFQFSRFKDKKLDDAISVIKRITPLSELTPQQKWILWSSKEHLINETTLLAKFLLSVPWHLPAAVEVAHRYLKLWKKPEDPLECLELLDYKFPDQKVRIAAVSELLKLGNNELKHYMLQLVQALRFELYHDSALARFLLQKGLSDQYIAQTLFWLLKSEMHILSIRERFGLILEEFLKRVGGFRIELLKQNCVLEQMYQVAIKIKSAKKENYNSKLQDYLKALKLPETFKLPLNPSVILSSIVVEKCKVMTSAKLPLFMFFKNADKFAKDDFGILFKVGDDIKQDVLCLQMLRIMDQVWQKHKKDLHIKAYHCINTGDMQGMLELVQRAETIADISYSKGVKKMLAKDVILNWLKTKNPKQEWDFMKENFLYSSAGYCVATYILGLGDRHNDNIMLSEKGDLFHIDFGHFLNHRKTFMGVKRETTPFVFPKPYAKVLGGKKGKFFKRFQKESVEAFKILRSKTNLIIVLLMLMLGSGLEEMEKEDDIKWVESAMVLEKNDKQVEKYFKYLIKLAMTNQRQILNDAWHITWHKIINSK